MPITKREIQFIKSELIAHSIIDVLAKEGYFDLWVLARDRTKIVDGNVYTKFEKVNSSIEALDELRYLIIKEIEKIV